MRFCLAEDGFHWHKVLWDSQSKWPYFYDSRLTVAPYIDSLSYVFSYIPSFLTLTLLYETAVFQLLSGVSVSAKTIIVTNTRENRSHSCTESTPNILQGTLWVIISKFFSVLKTAFSFCSYSALPSGVLPWSRKVELTTFLPQVHLRDSFVFAILAFPSCQNQKPHSAKSFIMNWE